MTQRDRQQGFTLVELVIAIAILSTSILAMLYLRTAAVDRVRDAKQELFLQRLAQEKMDAVMFGLEQELEGEFEENQKVTYSIQAQAVGMGTQSSSGVPLAECTIELNYNPDERQEPIQYTLTSWFFPPEESPIYEMVAIADDEESEY